MMPVQKIPSLKGHKMTSGGPHVAREVPKTSEFNSSLTCENKESEMHKKSETSEKVKRSSLFGIVWHISRKMRFLMVTTVLI